MLDIIIDDIGLFFAFVKTPIVKSYLSILLYTLYRIAGFLIVKIDPDSGVNPLLSSPSNRIDIRDTFMNLKLGGYRKMIMGFKNVYPSNNK